LKIAMEKWILKLLPLVLTTLTPTMKQLLEQFLIDFKKKAEQTKNPWDDLAAELLLMLIGSKR